MRKPLASKGPVMGETGVDLSQRDVVVLADARSFSAADFATLSLGLADNVTVIGEPTGGGFSSAGGEAATADFNVGYSTLLCADLDGNYLEGNPPMPDVTIVPRAGDIRAGVDTALEEAFSQVGG